MRSFVASAFRFVRRKVCALALVKRDGRTGMPCYLREGIKIFIRYRHDYVSEETLRWHCENLYWRHFTPEQGDVVVDLGAGYGEEAVYLAKKSPGVRYFGVEVQPSVYECLSNTFAQIPGYRAVPFAVGPQSDGFIRISSQKDYISVSSHRAQDDVVEVPTLSFSDLLKKYQIEHVSLLKANIEGAEKAVLEGLTSEELSRVGMVLISCHDFRANRGQGEYFRTKAAVEAVLTRNKFEISRFSTGIDSVDDWIFAVNRGAGALSRAAS